jgi:hypothetical protein
MTHSLQWLGNIVGRIREVYAPLADMRITIVALALGGVILLGVEAGKDVIRSLVDSANATDFRPRWENAPVFLRWTLFLLACIWTGINAWYWSHILYKIKPGAADEQPHWFRWLRRVLGIAPILFAIIAMPLSARRCFEDTWVAMLLFSAAGGLLMWFFVSWQTISLKKWRVIERITRPVDIQRSTIEPNSLVAGDVWFIFTTIGVSVTVFSLLLIPWVRTHFSWIVGPAALTFGAIGCIIPVTSLLIHHTRPYKLPIILIGLWCFVIFSLWNDNHEVRSLNVAAPGQRPSVEDALKIWETAHPDPADPIVLIAAAGGASRAAYWTATVLRALDDRTGGTFFDHVFAMSSVSGGTLGTIGYATWLADRPLAAEGTAESQRRHFVQTFFGQDYLGPSVGGLLYPDLVQRFFFLPVFPDRAGALEEAFEMGWDKSMRDCEKPPCGAEPGRFSQEYSGLWKRTKLHDPAARWVPIVLANGTHVETGKRIISAPVKIDSTVFEDTYDFYNLNPKAIRASTAVLNSARFTVVSPPGRLMMKNGKTNGGIIDGGYFENGALETVYDLARYIKTRTAKANRKIIIIEILNDDTMSEADLARHHPGSSEPLKVADPPKPHFWSPVLSEVTSIVGGLYHTRSARGTLGAKRLSAPGNYGLTETTFYSFDLRPYGNNWHTAMSWALSPGSLDVMDVSFNVKRDDVPKFLENRHYLSGMMKKQIESLQKVIDKAKPNRDVLENVLTDATFSMTLQSSPGPGEAAKRK